MKNSVIALSALVLIVSQSCAQKSKHDAPDAVKSAFSIKFPNATKVKWDKENNSEWEAEFKQNGIKYSANFTSAGDWKETEHEISKNDIPAGVKARLDSDFADYKIEEAEISETASGTVYEFELENDEYTMEVAINEQGDVTKKEIKESEDGDED